MNSNTTDIKYTFTYVPPFRYYEECDCDICPCCGKRRRRSLDKPWIVTCGGQQ